MLKGGVTLLTLRLLQLASLICASCEAGLRFIVLPNGLIIVETARFNLLGVLLKLKARPTFSLVREANLEKIELNVNMQNHNSPTLHFKVITCGMEQQFINFINPVTNVPKICHSQRLCYLAPEDSDVFKRQKVPVAAELFTF